MAPSAEMQMDFVTPSFETEIVCDPPSPTAMPRPLNTMESPLADIATL